MGSNMGGVFVGFLLLCGSIALGNGKYMPSAHFESVPTVPAQTAVIKFADGVQTLVVESSMHSEEGESFVWLLPVPSEPTELAAFPPGFLKTMRTSLGPLVLGPSAAPQAEPAFLAVAFTSILTIGFMLRRKGWIVRVLALLLLIIFICLLAPPNYLDASARGPELQDVEVLRRERVGNYDTAVLRAKKAEDLNGWLSENGFSTLPADSYAVVRSYIDEDWCFVASRLAREDKGLLTPHPLMVTFETSRPVYPMRLTAGAGSQTAVDLFLIGTESYRAEMFKIICSDRFMSGTASAQGGSYPIMRATRVRAAIGHPTALALIEEGNWVTRLSATLSPQEMKADIYFEGSKELAPYQQQLYTKTAALQRGIAAALYLIAAMIPVTALLYRRRSSKPLMLALLAWPLLVVPVMYLATERTADSRGIANFAHEYRAYQSAVYDYAVAPLTGAEQPVTPTNLFTGQPLAEGDGPGEYTLDPSAEPDPVVLLHDWRGIPVRLKARTSSR